MKEISKQVNKLIIEALAIEARDAKEAGALGYMARALVQATMPHKKVEGNEFTRVNGAYTLTILSPSIIGLPYGSIPRLLLAWITTEAVQRKQRELALGTSLGSFMEKLGLIPTGGRWGTITRLREQTKRLFTSAISCVYSDEKIDAGLNINVAEEYQLWWDPKKPEQNCLWESTLILSKRFYEEIVDSPVPIDMDALKVLKRSPMALDIYCWLTYRMSYLRTSTSIPWRILEMQFGADYQHTRNFKIKFLQQLKKVSIIYPEAKLEVNETGLLLRPSKLHIPLKDR